MVEPIRLLVDENEKELTVGKCCVCGEEWDLKKYKPEKTKQVKRYLDGMPLSFTEKDMKNVCYCKNCNNVTIFEYPFSDTNGVRDRCGDKQYEQILALNEPIEVRRVKLAEYKFQGTKDDCFVLQILQLYWYYDSIGDKKQMAEYAEKLIKLYERNISYSIKVETRCLLQIAGKSFRLHLEMILIDIYRRMGNFNKAKELIEIGKSKIYIKDDDIIQMQWFKLQSDLCDKQNTNRY